MNWSLLTVELAVCAWILLLLAADLLVPPARQRSLWGFALAGVAVAAALLATQQPPPLGDTFQDSFLVDRFSVYCKYLFLLTTAVVIVMTRIAFRPSSHAGAFYVLLFTALLGMLVLASMNDLLMLFLGLELVTFSLYIMTAYLKTDPRSVEAGMKYLIVGSTSSGFLLFGIALLYGFAGGTSFPVIRSTLAGGPIPLTAQAGLLLVLAGLGFKIAAVPFQFWAPDVYEGAPTPVTALVAVGSKTAGIVALLRVLDGVFLPLSPLWAPLLAGVSAVTMGYGNLAAIPQVNIKRLMAYSSIGHAGYLVMGLSTASVPGVEAILYYLLAYLFSTLTVFLVIVTVSEAIGGESLEHYRGLSKRSAGLAAAMFIGLLSLAGVPPLAGFVGKLLVLLATAETGRLWLVLIGAINVAVSLYYYLMVIKRMYLDEPRTTAPIPVNGLTAGVLAFLVLGIVVLGIVQDPFLQHIALAVPP
ncbi:MAG: NADH-quinone oxidoreductase subunit N [Candidatus Omnitrophota bacterium]|nr:NADH-quinone oxidoreductase subunit N [Candidatus Omnitrophota bacterium]